MSLTVIILCGGKGERLRPLTLKIPKPLIKINKKSILEIILEHLSKSKLEHVVLATGYKSWKFKKFTKIKFKNSFIKVTNSGDVNIINRINKCLKFNFINDDFMLVYGDTITALNINKLIKSHKKNKKLVTVGLLRYKSQFGLMRINKYNLVKQYQEKPILDYWINIGYFYFSKKTISIIKRFETFEKFLSYIVKIGQLNGYKYSQSHSTVNNYSELLNLKKIFNSK
jgi:NDP-sugar pyrophosphorylase family protein